jgi:hypothetical protein
VINHREKSTCRDSSARYTTGLDPLRTVDLELEISKRTLNSRQESLRLTRILSEGGSTSLLDVRQAEQLVFTASAEIPILGQQIEQQGNFLSILLGQNPSDIPRGQTLTEKFCIEQLVQRSWSFFRRLALNVPCSFVAAARSPSSFRSNPQPAVSQSVQVHI